MQPIPTKKLLAFYANMPDELHIEVNKKAFEKYHKLKQHTSDESLNRSERFHAALLSVLEHYYYVLKVGTSKKQSKELTSLEEQTKLRLKMLSSSQKKKKMTKRDKLIYKYGPMIYFLKEREHQSYVKMASYLSKFHHFKIDQSYICMYYPSIKQNIEATKNEALQNEFF